MKKVGVALLFILLFSSLVLAEVNNSTSTSTTNSSSNVSSSSTATTSISANMSKLEKGYTCLDNKALGKCSTLSVPEISFILLSNPSSNLATQCKAALMAKKSTNNCWPSASCTIKDTALAILALDNLGEDTTAYETWLLSKNQTPTDIVWFLEEDSENNTQCKITYSGNDNTINIGSDKKIDSNAGSCLTRAQSNFWLQVSSSCYDREFAVSCDKNFISTLLYKHESSPTIYVSSDTKSSQALGTVTLKINAKCFGLSSCDYEGSLWATLALLSTGNDVQAFIPYIIALGDVNKKYLPNSFIYASTNYPDYATRLIQEQRLGNYWEADSSVYGKYYDTALALLSLKDSSAAQVNQAKLWLEYSQDTSSGCWKGQNELRDTAIILWAITDRTPTGGDEGPTTTCEEADFFCIARQECPSSDQLSNYYCPGVNPVCCKTENLQTCEEYTGQECPQGKICSGTERKASDTNYCCLAECTVPEPTGTECENNGYFCKDACSEGQETVSSSCSGAQICCRTKTPSSGNGWIWFLVIGIIIALAVILFLLRDKIKLWWFNFRNKVKKDSSRPGPGGPMPPRPGFPPFRPMPGRPLPQRQMQPPRPMPSRPPMRKEDDTFKKLREMSK